MLRVAARIEVAGKPGHRASEMLLGMNIDPDRIEGRDGEEEGIQSNRLRNGRFLEPEDTLGLARFWQSEYASPPTGPFVGQHFALTRGLNGPGRLAQMIHNTGGGEIGIVQVDRWVRAGERLVLSLWARAHYRPTPIRVGIRPRGRWQAEYDSTAIVLEPAAWKEYHAILQPPLDDDHALFFIYVLGEGLVWLDQVHLAPEGSGVIRRDFEERVRDMRIPVLRFPGSSGILHRWRSGLGPHHLRPLEQLPLLLGRWRPTYDFATDEYLGWCRDFALRPHFTVNIGTGSAREAADWASYVAEWYQRQGLAPPPAYWQIGNEPWLPYDPAHMTPDHYARVLAEYAPEIKAAYPRALILAAAQKWHWTDRFRFREPAERRGRVGEDAPWRVPMLDAASPADVDVLAVQLYPRGIYDRDEHQEFRNALSAADRYDADVSSALEDGHARGFEIPVGITEWNLWIHASSYDMRGFYEPYATEHVLFFAEVMCRLIRRGPAVEVANFYCLHGPMRVLDCLPGRIAETGIAQAYRLYRPALPGHVLPLRIVAPSLSEIDGRPAVDAVATVADNGVGHLFIVNRSFETPVEVEVAGMPVDAARGLAGRRPRDGVAAFEPDWSTRPDGVTLIVPPLSVTQVRFTAGSRTGT